MAKDIHQELKEQDKLLDGLDKDIEDSSNRYDNIVFIYIVCIVWKYILCVYIPILINKQHVYLYSTYTYCYKVYLCICVLILYLYTCIHYII